MRTSLFLNIYLQLPRHGTTSGGGEPTLADGLASALAFAKESGLQTRLVTNGVLLEGALLDSVLENTDMLRVSIDAADRRLYKTLRGSDDFAKVCRNVEKIAKLRSGMKPAIKIKFLVENRNISSMGAAFELAKSLGADGILFKRKRVFGRSLEDKQLGRVTKIASALREENPAFVSFSFGTPTAVRRCYLTPLNPVVDPNGDIFICCYYMEREEAFKIGNVLSEGLEGVWGSGRHLKAISSINPKDCYRWDCRFLGYMQHIEDELQRRKFS